MKYLLFLGLSLVLFGCQEEKSNPQQLKDMNFYVDNYKKLDSIEISDVSEYEKYRISDFQDPYISASLKREVNDLYKVVFYSGETRWIKRLWLDGEQPLIYLSVDSDLKIDSIQNSTLNQDVSEYSRKLAQLYDKKADTEQINLFLLKSIEKHLQSPFSYSIAQIYWFRNRGSPKKMKKLQNLLAKQADSLHQHSLYKSLKKKFPQ